jgi:hypothetical protein
VSGAVRGLIGRSGMLFYYYIQSENVMRFIVSECNIRMLSGWVVAARREPRNLTLAHVSYS